MRSTRREVFTSLLVAPALAGIAAAGFAKSETLEANKRQIIKRQSKK